MYFSKGFPSLVVIWRILFRCTCVFTDFSVFLSLAATIRSCVDVNKVSASIVNKSSVFTMILFRVDVCCQQLRTSSVAFSPRGNFIYTNLSSRVFLCNLSDREETRDPKSRLQFGCSCLCESHTNKLTISIKAVFYVNTDAISQTVGFIWNVLRLVSFKMLSKSELNPF